MIIILARSTTVSITYNGKNISEDIAPFLTSFTFTDNTGKTADDISFTLEDREGLWLNNWSPSKGDTVQASIVLHDNASVSLPCGKYQVDQIDYSCPPHVMTVKAVSAGIKSKLRETKISRVWENTSLRAIAQDIAGNSGLSLYFDAEDVQLERREQIRQSDSAFLQGLCSEFGLSVKINEGKIIILDEGRIAEKSSSADISASDPALLSWRFSSKASGVYKKAKFKYHNHAKDETFEAEAEDDAAEGTEKVLMINEHVSDSKEAQAIAKRKLAEANMKEITGSIVIMNGIKYRAGINITLNGFGLFSGKYLISKAVHSVSSGYTATLELKAGSSAKKASKKSKGKKQSHPSEQYYTGTKFYGA